ncbi:hypothetical protein SLEP1_g52331 [Rubroshorea leprosula]|uniref:Integrase catalytic domain-containing protein n=1 Tax=Rubroshorea leprosula TaxID=152421 RepID=A0AAV5M6U5_9ROSI|nr:hypothetical protein SLEP1_g52331 [Rubroshorea leprosula]
MPLRKSKDKEGQPAQAEHADDSPLHSEGENDLITFLPVSPLAERSYGNLVFKENEADRGGDFAESSNVFRGMPERLELAFKEKNQAMRRLVESQAEFSRRQEETIRQCMSELRRIFEKGTNVMRETGDESRRTLKAVSEQVVEQVRQPRPEIPSPVVEMPRQIQEAPIPALGGQGNHGHQPQHKYILPARKGNVSPHHQPCPRDFFQPQVPPTQLVQRGLQNQPAQFFNRDHGPALRSLEKIDKGILKFPDKAKETMGVDADPFLAMFVGVNVADLRSVARNRSLPYAQRNLAAEDLRWVIEAQRSRHSRSVRSDQQRLRGQGRIIVTRNFSPEGARRYSTGTRSRKRAEERKRQQKQVEAEGSSSRRPRQPTKRNMVWVRKEKKEAVIQNLLKGNDQSPASPKVASVIVSPDGVLKATFEAQEQFGLPETITTDQGTVFVSHQVEAFAKEMGFRLLNSTPHYAQANGQAEASNKVVINLLEKMVDDNPIRWHELLSETLWAYRTSQRSSTKMTPFALTYGHDAVLPMELTARSLRIAIQHNLQSGEYDEAMMLKLEDLEDTRLTALDRLQAQKLKVAKSYNKRVKGKNMAVGDLVWKAILPLGKKDHKFGKWSPNWEGPFRIHEVLSGGAYWLESLDGELHPRKINGIYLKPYYPIVWEARDLESQEAV